MSAPIRQFIELGELQRRIAQLLDLTADEVKQLRAAGQAEDSPPDHVGIAHAPP